MYIIREVHIAMFVIRIIQLRKAFIHSYHTCKFDIDWISILCLCPLPASRKGLRLPLRSALFGEGGSDWRP